MRLKVNNIQKIQSNYYIITDTKTKMENVQQKY